MHCSICGESGNYPAPLVRTGRTRHAHIDCMQRRAPVDAPTWKFARTDRNGWRDDVLMDAADFDRYSEHVTLEGGAS